MVMTAFGGNQPEHARSRSSSNLGGTGYFAAGMRNASGRSVNETDRSTVEKGLKDTFSRRSNKPIQKH